MDTERYLERAEERTVETLILLREMVSLLREINNKVTVPTPLPYNPNPQPYWEPFTGSPVPIPYATWKAEGFPTGSVIYT